MDAIKDKIIMQTEPFGWHTKFIVLFSYSISCIAALWFSIPLLRGLYRTIFKRQKDPLICLRFVHILMLSICNVTTSMFVKNYIKAEILDTLPAIFSGSFIIVFTACFLLFISRLSYNTASSLATDISFIFVPLIFLIYGLIAVNSSSEFINGFIFLLFCIKSILMLSIIIWQILEKPLFNSNDYHQPRTLPYLLLGMFQLKEYKQSSH